MANDLATLRAELRLKIRDTDATAYTWSNDELDDILRRATSALYPSITREIEADLTIVEDAETYSLPATMRMVSSIDLLQTSGWQMVMRLPAGTWETRNGTIYLNRTYSQSGHTFRVHGYGEYDLVTNLPEDRFVPLILARATAEALRRLIPDRAQFKKWLTRNQEQNISVNELVLMINDADQEVQRLEGRLHTWKRPVPGRV